MILGLRHAAVCVTDIRRSIEFYEKFLGFSPYHVSDRDWAMLCRAGTSLSLLTVAKKNPVSMAKALSGHAAHLGIVVETPEELDGMRNALLDAGAEKVGTIENHRDGSRGFYLVDPDGNQLECIFIPLCEPGSGEGETVLLLTAQNDPSLKESLVRSLTRHSGRAKVLVESVGVDWKGSEAVLKKVLGGIGSGKLRVIPYTLQLGAVEAVIQRACEQMRREFPQVEVRLQLSLSQSSWITEAIAAEIFCPSRTSR